MEKSHLLQLLNAFSAAEKRALRKFLRSPYFNQREDVVRLFDALCAPARPEKAPVKRLVFGDAEAPDQELRLRMTYLHRLIERFLALRELEAREPEQRLQLAGAYRRRGLGAQFERVRKGLDKTLEDSPRRDTRYHQLRFGLHWETHQLSHVRNPTELGHLRRASAAADVAYLTLKLRLICLQTAHQTLYAGGGQSAWETEAIGLAERHYAQEHPAIRIYLHCYRMMRFPEEESHFRAFKNLLLDGGGLFSEEEMHGLFIWAVNYCVRRLNAGEARYYREALDLYKPGLESGYLLENGILKRFTYHNVVAAGIHTGELEWVEFFIYNYKNSLEKQYRESAFQFNLARLEFARGRYGAVLQRLQKANYRDVLVNLAAKTLLLKAYYELGAYDLLQSHLDAMHNYIGRKRVLGYHRANYLNVIRYTAKLLALNFGNKKEVEQLRTAVGQEAQLPEREWLLKQLD